MKDDVYSYDAQLYDRSYLNCYQRQALRCMLAERVPDLHLFFYNCLVSSDSLLDHVVRNQSPKYAFQDDRFWDPDALARIGVVRHYLPFNTYAEGRQTILDAIADVGYAVPHIDVFYLPHCPEYYNQHVLHTITLTVTSRQRRVVPGRSTTGPACDAVKAADPEDVTIAAAFDTEAVRCQAGLCHGQGYDAEEANEGAVMASA